MSPRDRKKLQPPPPPRMRVSLLLLGGAVVVIGTVGVLLKLIGQTADGTTPGPKLEQSSPPDPRLFDLVPSDLMTTRDGLSIAPGPHCVAGDAALRRGAIDMAVAAYDAACAADGRDRYAGLLATCLAIEQGRWSDASEALRKAATPAEPIRSPLRSLRIAAWLLARHALHPQEALADGYLHALAQEATAESNLPRKLRDPLFEQARTRVLAEHAADRGGWQMAPERQEAFAIVLGDDPLPAARAALGAGDLALELWAMTRLHEQLGASEAPRLIGALRARAESEPDNAYYSFLLAGLLATDALGIAAGREAGRLTLANEDEPDLLPGIFPEAIAALEEAWSRPRCNPHLRALVTLEADLRRDAGDRFAMLHGQPPEELLFLGDPRLRDRITYRAMVADAALAMTARGALLRAGVALAAFATELAPDPRTTDSAWAHRDGVEALLITARQLALDLAPLTTRQKGCTPLVTLREQLKLAFGDALSPLPIPRLVDQLGERYAADLPALAATLTRYADAP